MNEPTDLYPRGYRRRPGRGHDLPEHRRGRRVRPREEEQQEERDLPQSGHKHPESVAFPASVGERASAAVSKSFLKKKRKKARSRGEAASDQSRRASPEQRGARLFNGGQLN